MFGRQPQKCREYPGQPEMELLRLTTLLALHSQLLASEETRLGPPIINHPEVAILGVHKAREMPVVRNGEIVVRRIMNVSAHSIIESLMGLMGQP